MEVLLQIITALATVVFLEGLLSVDNALVISMIAQKARPADRNKVVNFGMIGAIGLRVIMLLFVSVIMNNPHIGGIAVLLGGVYLIPVGYKLITKQPDSTEEGEIPGWVAWLIRVLRLTVLTATITEVMFTDLVFSIDNLFAAVAMTQSIKGTLLGMPLSMICCILGVVLGILTMSRIIKYVMQLIQRYPALNQSAGVVIVLLGLKLLVSAALKLTDPEAIAHLGALGTWLATLAPRVQPYAPYLESHATDFIFSGVTLIIFLWPIVYQRYQRHTVDGENAAIIQQLRDGHLPALTGQSFSRKEAEQILDILSKRGPVEQQYYKNVVAPRVKAERTVKA
ncbi:putative membrane protein yceF [Fibrella aestuarina BUZ 2]|uniref:Putative membrane protein yceF n=1 Tax=Fibrella aestuarina BUZ 2 TaxID=1166018 RepID=I0KCX8_9BACT|nr:hypothetical protein [Fibrella aestuarina]CCH01981.1 putative membrane protein yceF [Fibrella aestuarina BUZ 2]